MKVENKNEVVSISLGILKKHNENKKICFDLHNNIKSLEDFNKARYVFERSIVEEVALEVLPIEHRAVISMRLIDRMKYKDIALYMGSKNKRLDYKGKALFINSLIEYYKKYNDLVYRWC